MTESEGKKVYKGPHHMLPKWPTTVPELNKLHVEAPWGLAQSLVAFVELWGGPQVVCMPVKERHRPASLHAAFQNSFEEMRTGVTGRRIQFQSQTRL